MPTRRPLAKLCLSLALVGVCLLWQRASAFGLGELTSGSWLGAPFEASIPLVVSPGERDIVTAAPDSLRVELGSPADYARLGVEHTALHLQLQISLEEEAGRPVVRLRTPEPVLEPFLELVLAVRTPQGRLVRNYTVLIDPPPALAAIAPAGPPREFAPARSPEPRALPAVAMSAMAPTAAPAAPLALPAGSHLTRPGDSLWRIARNWSGGRSVALAMDAIVAANPDAFIDGDPERLQAGVVLTLPGAQPATVAADTAPAADARVSTIPQSGTRLEVVAPTAPAVVPPAYRGYQQRVEGINAAVGELADSLQHARARLERMDRELRGVMAAYDHQRDTQSPGAPMPVARLLPVAATDTAMPWPATVGLTPSVAGDAGHAAETTTIDFRPLGFGLALALLGLAAGWSGWRLRPGAGPAAQRAGNDAAAGAAPTMSFAAAASASPQRGPAGGATGGGAGRTSAERPAVPVNGFTPTPTIADESVDPATSAGVYLAFGRLAEAEQLLTEALTQHPERHDLQLLLLDIYLQSGDSEAFEQLAAALAHQFVEDQTVLDELSILQEAYDAARRESPPASDRAAQRD